MNPFLIGYSILGHILLGFTLPLFPFLQKEGYLKGFSERLGIYPDHIKIPGEGKRVMIHCASVGEFWVARHIAGIVQEEKEAIPILSVFTPSGKRVAEKASKFSVIHPPLDLPLITKAAINRIKPDILILVETELWPNLIHSAHKAGCKVLLINGRISRRSYRRYKRLKSFIRPILKEIDSFLMIGEREASRIVSLGADPSKVKAIGNLKEELLIERINDQIPYNMRARLNIRAGEPVFVAGSIRHGEEKIILNLFSRLKKRYPKLILIIVPRHINWIDDIEVVIKQLEFSYIRASLERRKQEPIILVDYIGDLFNIYSLADIVFCGGSLVPKGGQNILEPASWGIPVIYGPYMDDFLYAHRLLNELGAGIMVKDEDEFYEKACWILDNPDKAKEIGNEVRKYFEKHLNASNQVKAVLREMLTSIDG